MIKVISRQTMTKTTNNRLMEMESQSIAAKFMGGRLWGAPCPL
jgi:hypothetical protein